MSIASNSKLISKLNQENNEDKIIEILEEMEEIGDPYFLQPIYDKYKENEDSSISHYFLGSIAKFKSEDSKVITIEIGLNPQTLENNFLFNLDFLTDIEFYDEAIINRAKEILSRFNENDDEYDLDPILLYLYKAKSLIDYANLLKEIFEDKNFRKRIREKALYYHLRVNSNQHFQYYFDNYGELKKDEITENIFAHEILSWDKGIIPKFQQKIMEEGGDRAKEIINEHFKIKEETKRKEVEKNEAKAIIKHFTSSLIKEIYALRENINTYAFSNWKVKLFLPSEILYKQIEAAEQKSILVYYCNDLRAFIKIIDPMCNYENLAEAQKTCSWIVNEEELKMPFNQLHLYLQSQGIKVENKLFGLRDLNSLFSLIDHPETDIGLISLLKEMQLIDLWNQQEWGQVHKKILEMYKTALEKLHSSLLERNKLKSND